MPALTKADVGAPVMADPEIFYSGLVVTCEIAKRDGLKRYFTGRPCRHGHISQRQTRAGACCACVRKTLKCWRLINGRLEESRRYRAKHSDKLAETSKRYWKRHAERLRPIEAERAAKRRKADPEGQKRRSAAYKARLELKLAEVAGRPRPTVCDVCTENNLQIVFDHCHRSGQFRGWLCDRCNKLLGIAKDSPILLKALALYLENADVEADGQSSK